MNDCKQSELEVVIRKWICGDAVQNRGAIHESQYYGISIVDSQIIIYDPNNISVKVTKLQDSHGWITWYSFEMIQKTEYTSKILEMFQGLPVTYPNNSNRHIRLINRYVKPKYIDIDSFNNFNDLPDQGIIVTKDPNYKHYKIKNRTIELHLKIMEPDMIKTLVLNHMYLNVMDKSNKMHIKLHVTYTTHLRLMELLDLNVRRVKWFSDYEFVKEFICKTDKSEYVDILAKYHLEQLLIGGLKIGATLTNHTLADPRLCKYINSFF